MSVRDFLQKIKYAVEDRNIFIVIIIVMISFGSFGLGRLSKLEEARMPVRIESSAAVIQVNKSAKVSGNSEISAGKYVVSKNGSKYHYPWCSGAQRIKEENKIWFNTKEDAEKQGYTPAANCKGL